MAAVVHKVLLDDKEVTRAGTYGESRVPSYFEGYVVRSFGS